MSCEHRELSPVSGRCLACALSGVAVVAVLNRRLAEAHAEIGRLKAQIAATRKEHNEEMREAQRDCAIAAAEARAEERGFGRGEW